MEDVKNRTNTANIVLGNMEIVTDDGMRFNRWDNKYGSSTIGLHSEFQQAYNIRIDLSNTVREPVYLTLPETYFQSALDLRKTYATNHPLP